MSIRPANNLQVFKTEELLLGAIIPAQQGEEVEHGLGQEALLTKLPEAGGSVPLAQLAFVWRKDETDMAEMRLSPP